MKKVIAVLSMCAALVGTGYAQDANQDPMKALGMLFGAGGTNAAVHHSELKALLPTEFSGMKRVNSEAGKQNAMGMNITYAQASYSDDNASLDVKITDMSGMGQLMIFAEYGWANSEIERETETGYERTVKLDSFPAKESYDTESQSGKLEIFVDSRFMVEIDGNSIAMEKLKELVSAINLSKLQSLKPKPPAQ